MELDEVDAIGQGRVWTGVDALEHGLVDELGNLNDAIAIAAELGGLADGTYGTRFIEEGLSPTEQLIVEMLESLQRVGLDPDSFGSSPTQLERIAGKLEQMPGADAALQRPERRLRPLPVFVRLNAA